MALFSRSTCPATAGDWKQDVREFGLTSFGLGVPDRMRLGPVVGQQAFTTTDDGATWTAGFANGAAPADNLFALVGSADTPESLIAALEVMVAGLGLDRATEKGLQSRLQLALADLGSGDVTAACSALQDFITFTRSKAVKKLTSAQATTLIDAATGIRTLIGC